MKKVHIILKEHNVENDNISVNIFLSNPIETTLKRHMKTLGELLRLCRKEGHLTQQKLVDDLSVASPLFKDLNSVTLSRWETGTTTPGLQKKKSLLRYLFTHFYFDTPKCIEYLEQSFQNLSKPLGKQLDHKYQEIIGNMAPFKVKADQYHFGFLKAFSDIRLTYIINIERANHPDHYYTLDLPTLRSWIAHESSFCLGCTLNEEHLGHIILLKLKPHIAREVIHNRRSVFTLGTDDLSPADQQGTYLIHTFFINGLLSSINKLGSINGAN